MSADTKPATLTDQIRQAVKDSGKTAYRICQDLNLDKGHFRRFMAGTGSFLNETLDRLAAYLGLSVVARPKQEAPHVRA